MMSSPPVFSHNGNVTHYWISVIIQIFFLWIGCSRLRDGGIRFWSAWESFCIVCRYCWAGVKSRAFFVFVKLWFLPLCLNYFDTLVLHWCHVNGLLFITTSLCDNMTDLYESTFSHSFICMMHLLVHSFFVLACMHIHLFWHTCTLICFGKHIQLLLARTQCCMVSVGHIVRLKGVNLLIVTFVWFQYYNVFHLIESATVMFY